MNGELHAPCGRLAGRGQNRLGVTAFLGVPYAAPPVGPLRWKPPQRLEPWHGVRSAATVAWRSIQHAPYGELEPQSPGMREDCLYLNVWTPDVAAKLPVIFWIHGGEFWAGSGSEPRYDGSRLAARGAVVVTFNHRLGLFGFLSHPELSAESSRGTSGNYGLLDQIAALEWTHANIAAFGGDPGNITVAGESAGSCSVSFLMAAPQAKHLFHRAIGESCAYFMPEPHAMKPLSHAANEARGVAFAEAAGVRSLAELRAMDGEALLAVWLKDPSQRMQPCIDGHILPDVASVFRAGGQARVPLLAGWNGDEYGFMRGAGSKFDAVTFARRLADSFGADGAAALLTAYAHDDPLETATQLTSDRLMVWPTWKWAEEHARLAPVFVYEFDRAAPGSAFGATHASEIEYVFGTLDSKARNYGAEDYALSGQTGDYWVNFARSGDPNGATGRQWPAYGRERNVLHLDAPITVRAGRSERLELLARLYAERGAG